MCPASVSSDPLFSVLVECCLERSNLVEDLSCFFSFLFVVRNLEEGVFVVYIHICCGVKECAEAVVISVWNRFIRVCVALNTAKGETLSSSPSCVYSVNGR